MTDKITKPDKEWREQLSDLAYKVTRKHGTERAFSNDNFPKQEGVFSCICCDAPLLRTYLSMGGRVSDHAVVDSQLDTLHVFTGLDIAAIPAARAKLLRADAQAF